MLKINRARQVATFLMLSSAWWLAFSPSPVRAQTSQTQPTTEAEQSDITTDDATDSENGESASTEETSTEETEFDELILGPWINLAKVTDGLPDSTAIKTSLKRCFTPPKISELKVESGADRKLPDPINLAGDMVYYRTEKGLQRFDFAQGYLVLLTEIRKVEGEGKPTTWDIRGAGLRYRIRFAKANKQGRGGQFMIENTNVYLRCPRPDKDKKTTDQ